jgi:hypothetical protein
MPYRVADIAGAVSQADADNQRARLTDLQARQGEQNLSVAPRLADLQLRTGEINLENAQAGAADKQRAEAMKQMGILAKGAESVFDDGSYQQFKMMSKQMGVPTESFPAQYDQNTQAMLKNVMDQYSKLSTEYETVQGPGGSIMQRDRTGKLSAVIGREPTKDWQMPGYINAQRQINEQKKAGAGMSTTSQKELFEADESLQAASNVMGLLNRAKEINKDAKYGPYAATRAKAISLLPGESDSANKTIDLDNIMTGQALESLKLIFGGMPTEGERKILLDMQASVDKTPTQRAAILDRALELAQRRYEFNKSKADSLRSGSYFSESPDISSPSLNGATVPQAPTAPGGRPPLGSFNR